MKNQDNAALFLIGMTMTVVLIPFAIIFYLYLKSKSKKFLEESYTLEKEIEKHFKSYLDIKKGIDTEEKNLSSFDKSNNKLYIEQMYSYYENLDKLDINIILIGEKMEIFLEKINFLKTMKIIRIKDDIIDKDFSKYNINANNELVVLAGKKKQVYELFREASIGL